MQSLEKNPIQSKSPSFLPYPASTLSPRIVPNDLTGFKSRGISLVHKDILQRLSEIKATYEKLVNEFNWNKIIYESHFHFEPVMGEAYYLYQNKRGFYLSMIHPGEWKRDYVGTFKLGADAKWQVLEISDAFDLEAYLGSL